MKWILNILLSKTYKSSNFSLISISWVSLKTVFWYIFKLIFGIKILQIKSLCSRWGWAEDSENSSQDQAISSKFRFLRVSKSEFWYILKSKFSNLKKIYPNWSRGSTYEGCSMFVQLLQSTKLASTGEHLFFLTRCY